MSAAVPVSAAGASSPDDAASLRERLRLPLMVVGVLAVLVGVLVVYLHGGRYMSTDDAYVQAARASIGSNVAGQVASVAVRDNQRVKRGDVLFVLDQKPFEIAVAEARAKLATARLQITAGKSTYRQQLATLRGAQDTLAYQQKEYERQQKLLAAGIASQVQFTQQQHALDTARQQLAAAESQAAAVLAVLGNDASLDPDQHPSVQQARAALDRAELDLSYATILAPDDGIVTKVEQLQVGDHVAAGSPVFALMSTRDVWIEANFKEDQLAYMRPGQSATVAIDSMPGRDFHARVVSLAPGTGSQFSALPAENATGNWVKVTQRLPVRLEIDGAGADDVAMSAGLSADVEVDTQHERTLLGGHGAGALRGAVNAAVANAAVPPHGEPVLNRRMITATVMLASILQTLDNTIANVALPHMQGSLSATQEQMSWVLTAYIVAAAIMTPLTGWLATVFGRRQLFIGSIVGFTLASVLCGVAQSLPQIVVFRFLQGLAGAALVPMSQAVLFDINPPERHGKAMAAWGQGVLVGPMIGPILGGWLTDTYSWRWVFYINVPLGILALIGVLAYFPKSARQKTHFDFFGFALLSVFIGALQILLDRGSTRDWFSSTEIWVEAIVTGLAFYLFAVHSATSRNPFIRPALFKDRNFLTGNLFIFIVGVVLFATLALLPTLLQVLLGYPVYEAGLLTAPRSVGTLIAMNLVGRMMGRVDTRLIIGIGFGLTAVSLWQMLQFDLQMDAHLVFWSGVLQGLGTGIAYVPMAAMTFATLPGNLRNEGTAMFSLTRNVGSSIGISIVQAFLVRNTQIVHASLAGHVSPLNLAQHNPMLAAQIASPEGLAAVNAAVTAQASMVAYLDDFKMMLIMTLLALPLLLLVRQPKKQAAKAAEDAPHVAIE